MMSGQKSNIEGVGNVVIKNLQLTEGHWRRHMEDCGRSYLLHQESHIKQQFSENFKNP